MRDDKMQRIILVGSAITEDELLDKIEPDDEVWSLNNLYGQFPNVKFTRWFELHTFKRSRNGYLRRGQDTYGNKRILDYMKDIDKLDIPVMMQKQWKVIKKSEVFPFEEIMQKHGNYFGCSFAWMIAYLLENYSPLDYIVRFDGISLNSYEYYYQRPSTEYMLGIMVGKGYGITIGTTSSLTREPYIYAYKEDYEVIDFLHVGFIRDLTTAIVSSITRYFVDDKT
jgi:hypothetical protein